MSHEDKRGPIKSGPFEVKDTDVAVVVFEKPDTIGDLAIGMEASVRAREGVPPWLIISALRQLADTLEMEFGGDARCPCGQVHD